MPAFVLADGSRTLSRYDVVGNYQVSGSRIVTHVGLLNSENQFIENEADVNAVHMKPPFIQGDAIRAHLAGRIPLTNDEIKQISDWIERNADEYGACKASAHSQYIIHPAQEEVVDCNTGVRRYTRYSCAGFVIDAYRVADVELLHTAAQALPEVDRGAIISAYDIDPKLLSRFGLHGDGPWRIVLAGYILHALDRTADEIRRGPYHAQLGDESF